VSISTSRFFYSVFIVSVEPNYVTIFSILPEKQTKTNNSTFSSIYKRKYCKVVSTVFCFENTSFLEASYLSAQIDFTARVRSVTSLTGKARRRRVGRTVRAPPASSRSGIAASTELPPGLTSTASPLEQEDGRYSGTDKQTRSPVDSAEGQWGLVSVQEEEEEEEEEEEQERQLRGADLTDSSSGGREAARRPEER